MIKKIKFRFAVYEKRYAQTEKETLCIIFRVERQTILRKTRSDYEKQYAQIEKETFPIVFELERFHQPLKSIISRYIVTCPPRIQKFSLRLQKYDFELEYAPGKTMLV